MLCSSYEIAPEQLIWSSSETVLEQLVSVAEYYPELLVSATGRLVNLQGHLNSCYKSYIRVNEGICFSHHDSNALQYKTVSQSEARIKQLKPNYIKLHVWFPHFRMNVLLGSELLALEELMSELLGLDPQQLVRDLYDSGVVDVQEAAETLAETLPLRIRMFLLLKFTFNPYRDMACAPFMAFVVALMKYNPSLALNLRQKQVKIQQALATQPCVRQELFSTYQSVFFDDCGIYLPLSTTACSSEIWSLSKSDEFPSEVSVITPMDASQEKGPISPDKDAVTNSNKVLLYRIPPMVDELDNKKLAEVLDTVEAKYQELVENKVGDLTGNSLDSWDHTAIPFHSC